MCIHVYPINCHFRKCFIVTFVCTFHVCAYTTVRAQCNMALQFELNYLFRTLKRNAASYWVLMLFRTTKVIFRHGARALLWTSMYDIALVLSRAKKVTLSCNVFFRIFFPPLHSLPSSKRETKTNPITHKPTPTKSWVELTIKLGYKTQTWTLSATLRRARGATCQMQLGRYFFFSFSLAAR